jgi:hypothetical protein
MLSLARLSKEKIRENQGEFSAVSIRPRSQLCAFSSPHMRKRKLVLKGLINNRRRFLLRTVVLMLSTVSLTAASCAFYDWLPPQKLADVLSGRDSGCGVLRW